MRLSNSFGFALFLLLLREKHRVFLLICLFLLITKVFIKFKQILFGKNIRLCAFKKQAGKLIANGVTIIDMFESHAAKIPEKIFLLFEDDSYTYAEIDQMANRMVRFIKHRGALECMDSAAIFMYNSPAFVTTWLALGKLGVKEVLLNYNLRSRSLLHCIKSCDTKVVICGPGKSF